MSMNAYHCCCVFSHNYDTALRKMEEIYTEKGSPNNVKKILSRDRLVYHFEDEEWVWIRPIESSRGYRAHKAYVSMDCTIEELENLIYPICNLYCDKKDFHLFR